MAKTDRKKSRTQLCCHFLILTIRTRNGKEFSQRNDGPVKGDPENPLSAEEVEMKFKNLTIPILGKKRSNEIISIIRESDRLDDVTKLVNFEGGETWIVRRRFRKR